VWSSLEETPPKLQMGSLPQLLIFSIISGLMLISFLNFVNTFSSSYKIAWYMLIMSPYNVDMHEPKINLIKSSYNIPIFPKIVTLETYSFKTQWVPKKLYGGSQNSEIKYHKLCFQKQKIRKQFILILGWTI
jgi:hypothetical protein